jgi:uncharacterized membrane protein
MGLPARGVGANAMLEAIPGEEILPRAWEDTGIPSFGRAGEAFGAGEMGMGALHSGLGVLGVLGMAPGGGKAIRPVRALVRAYARRRAGAGDNFPLTGQQRVMLSEVLKETRKSTPREAVPDLVRRGLWPEALAQDALDYLKGSARLRTARVNQYYTRPDKLALRRPGHALREFRTSKSDEARTALAEADKQAMLEAGRAQGAEALSLDEAGLWNKAFAKEVADNAQFTSEFGHDYGLRTSIVRANLEAVPRALKKEGWTVRHTSEGARGGRRSSRYLVSPDGAFEIRLSDHYLPDTPQRQISATFGGGGQWNDEMILSGAQSPSDVIDEIKRLHREFNEEAVLGNGMRY